MKVKITKDCEFRGVEYKKGEVYTVEGKTYRVLKLWKVISKPTNKSKSKETHDVAPTLDN
tara:strand:+ start:2967 stop:3146 length:180 start_codon:yes stop_codon:yes gene_type:complete